MAHTHIIFLPVILFSLGSPQEENDRYLRLFLEAGERAVQQEWERAEQLYRQVLTLNPGHIASYQGLGRALLEQRRSPEAIPILRKAVELDPSSSTSALYLGLAHFQTTDLGEAVFLLEKAIELGETSTEALLFLCRSYSALERQDRVAECWRGLLSDPLYQTEALFNLAQHDPASHAWALKRLQETAPNSFETLFLFAQALEDQGQFREAANRLLQAIAIRPEGQGLHYKLGRIYIKLADYQRALESFERELERNPSFAPAHLLLGIALTLEGRFEDAEKHLREACRLLPGSAQALYQLGQLLLRTGRLQEAISQLLVALVNEPDLAEAHYALAEAYRRLGKNQLAREHLAVFERLRNQYEQP